MPMNLNPLNFANTPRITCESCKGTGNDRELPTAPCDECKGRGWNPKPAPKPVINATLLEGSSEQQTIWEYLKTGTTHAVVDAVAGSGKSTTLVQGILRLKSAGLRICVFAFNKHIADEMNSKFTAAGINFANACTYNSFGWRAVRRSFQNVQLDVEKGGRIVMDVIEDRLGLNNLEYRERVEIIGGTRKLVSLCKAYLYDGSDAAQLDLLADKHNISLNGSAKHVFELVPLVLKASAEETSTVDFDDQVWLTITKGLPVDQYDIVMTDESQDLSVAQQELTFRACIKGRIVVVGDVRQAIYGWRGADAESMQRTQARLGTTVRGVQTFPLTVTRRCPKKHVELAQRIVPQIQALDNAPDGVILSMPTAAAVKALRPGDLVLCRTNAPLVSVCYDLIRRNVKAVIRGRDIGTGLTTLIDKLRAGDSVPSLLDKLREYRTKEMTKLARLGDKGTAKVQSLEDRVECLVALTDGVNSVSALKNKIGRIFADFDDAGQPKDAVVLGSVHRTKGLESGTVYVLCPELMPHPMATKPWEQVQELNLAYVAVTRAKFDAADTIKHPGKLVFVENDKARCKLPPAFGREMYCDTCGSDRHNTGGDACKEPRRAQSEREAGF